jgi:hypothetical protein
MVSVHGEIPALWPFEIDSHMNGPLLPGHRGRSSTENHHRRQSDSRRQSHIKRKVPLILTTWQNDTYSRTTPGGIYTHQSSASDQHSIIPIRN